MSTLHKQWMDLDGPTDVMAFPMDTLDDKPGSEPEPGPSLLGDVILCPEVAAKQAEEAGHSTDAELFLLTTHGVLHLLGYDHAKPDDEREMFELQTQLVTEWAQAHDRGPIKTQSRIDYRDRADSHPNNCERQTHSVLTFTTRSGRGRSPRHE